MLVKAGNPLDLVEYIKVTNNKPIELNGHMCRVLNVSKGQKMEVDEIVEEYNHKWGVCKCTKHKDYDHLAFIVED